MDKCKLPHLLMASLLAQAAWGQAPAGWTQRKALGSDLAEGSSWAAVGGWSAGDSGHAPPLVDGLGRGSALTGGGTSLEAGWKQGGWSFALKGLSNFDATGKRWVLSQAHALHTSKGGWVSGFEMEPLVWGYGLNGGYLLGEAARPFPRLKLASPIVDRSLFGIPLGQWGFQTFLGRLENGRSLSETMQDPAHRQSLIQSQGEPQAPFFSGYRLDARTEKERVSFYLNWVVLWGGNRNGKNMLKGYGVGDLLTAMTGTKDPLAEASIDWNTDPSASAAYVNKARSATNFDMGIRVQFPTLAKWMAAEKTWAYVSRGSKGMTVSWGVALRKPLYYLGKDLERDGRNLFGGHTERFWNESRRYYAPNLLTPNDTVGLLIQWPKVRLGVEYQVTLNDTWGPTQGYRSFVSGTYATGFYRYGDPLGTALGGEAITRTLRVEQDLRPNLSLTTWLHSGLRPFRDWLPDWVAMYPGRQPGTNRFQGIQQSFAWNPGRGPRPSSGWRVEGGYTWQKQSAFQNIEGNTDKGVRWFLDLGYRWVKP